MFVAGTEWIYSLIAHEIALHHDPYFVLKLLKHSGKYKILVIAAILVSFGAGMTVMRFIQKHASQKEINQALAIVNTAKGAESGNV